MIAGPRLLRRLATAVLLVALAGMVSTEQRQAAAGPPLQCTTDCYVATTGSDSNDGSQASPFLTIQKALDTVQDGGTVHVAAGLYNPNFNTIAKNVTLLGAQAGVDPSSRNPTDASTESIVQANTGFRVTMTVDVTIDGFTFQEKALNGSAGVSTGTGASDVGAMVTVQNNIFYRMNIGVSGSFGVNPSSFDISSNRFDGLDGETGILMSGAHSSGATLNVDGNTFSTGMGTGVRVLVWDGATITNNTFESIGVGFLTAPIMVGGCANCLIDGNTIATQAGQFSNGIQVIASNGPSTDTTVSNNTITSPTDPFNWAIWVAGSTGTNVTGNTITGAQENGIVIDYTASNTTVSDNIVNGGMGGGVFTRPVGFAPPGDGITITGNQLTNLLTGIDLGKDAVVDHNVISGATTGVNVAPTVDVTLAHINRNSIAGNTAGLASGTDSPVDATCNWWGSPSGPSGAGPGTGDTVSPNADFSLWLRSANLDGRCLGDQVVTDHYACYSATGPRVGARVTLEDQFGTRRTTVGRAVSLCNPADKNDEGTIDPTAHLTCYETFDLRNLFPPQRRQVQVANQFGEAQPLTVYAPATLCAPSIKNDDGELADLTVDHFQCYGATGKGPGVSVTLTDQFGSREVHVGKVLSLCTPVDKNDEGLADPETHLVCYSTTELRDLFRFHRNKVTVENQFGRRSLSVFSPSSLCVPSTKQLMDR